jgi:hypothetical protein
MGEYNASTDSYSGNTGAEVTFSEGGLVTTPHQPAEFHADTGFQVPGDLLSTAKSSTGFSVVGRQVQATDSVQVHGQRMSVAIAAQLGFLSQDPSGAFLATAEGQAGATHSPAHKAATVLVSGGTAEEAAVGDFRGTPDGEAAMDTLVAGLSPDLQMGALDSFLRNDGEVDIKVLERMASQAGVEPAAMEEIVSRAHAGMEEAVLKHLGPLGVYDGEAFAAFLHGEADTKAKFVEAVRDLVMHNSTRGLEGLAEQFAERVDMVDPESVEAALEVARIPFARNPDGGLVLDLSALGIGQVSFRQAVRAGLIKLSPETRR